MPSRTNTLSIVCFCLLLALPGTAAPAKDAGKIVDSGSFGVFVAGTRIGTETFTIEQTGTGSVTNSEIKVTDGNITLDQRSEMRLAANGDLVKYEWQEVSPGKGTRSVEVDQRSPDKFLMEHMTFGDKSKPIDKPFLSPASTVILDDYFFSHRQLLMWRYFGANCKPGETSCTMAKMPFGALAPHNGSSFLVNVEYKGKEKVTIRGAQVELIRVDLSSEDTEWSLWMDANYKVMRMVMAGANTEILRD